MCFKQLYMDTTYPYTNPSYDYAFSLLTTCFHSRMPMRTSTNIIITIPQRKITRTSLTNNCGRLECDTPPSLLHHHLSPTNHPQPKLFSKHSTLPLTLIGLELEMHTHTCVISTSQSLLQGLWHAFPESSSTHIQVYPLASSLR